LAEVKNASVLVIKHNLPMGLSWLEIPRGPLWTAHKKDLSDLFKEIKKIGKRHKAIFVRMSPYGNLQPTTYNLQPTNNDSHPTTSLVLDLSLDEEELLRQMKPKGRYNIKVAHKHGVTIEEDKQVDDFYDLLTKTGDRDGFGIHPESYYQNMLDSMPENAQLLLAEYDGKIISGGIFIYLDEWGIYYYGASDNEYRNVMAPYLIQWHAIKEAKERGCKYYDFLGIAPEISKNHPWKGVTQFKKKFGGKVVNYPKAKEMILNKFWHLLYKIYKKLR